MVSWPTNPNTWLFLTEPIPFTASCFTSYPHLRMISFLVMLKCQTETREHSLSPFLPRPRCRAVLHVSKYFSKKIIIFGSRCDNSVRLLRGAGRGGDISQHRHLCRDPSLSLTSHSGTFLATVTARPAPAGSGLTRTSSDFLEKIIRMKANIYNANNGNISNV